MITRLECKLILIRLGRFDYWKARDVHCLHVPDAPLRRFGASASFAESAPEEG